MSISRASILGLLYSCVKSSICNPFWDRFRVVETYSFQNLIGLCLLELNTGCREVGWSNGRHGGIVNVMKSTTADPFKRGLRSCLLQHYFFDAVRHVSGLLLLKATIFVSSHAIKCLQFIPKWINASHFRSLSGLQWLELDIGYQRNSDGHQISIIGVLNSKIVDSPWRGACFCISQQGVFYVQKRHLTREPLSRLLSWCPVI